MRNDRWGLVIFLAFVIVGLILGGIVYQSSLNHVSGGNPLPQGIDMAYKEIQLRGVPGVPRYVVIDTAGYNFLLLKNSLI
jgi:hypothetical protein